MNTKLLILIIALTMAIGNVEAKNAVRVKASSYDISDNLDLEAVASLFGDSDNLNDFERRLNNPKNEISNLDLNEDGYVDYLRVVEFTDNGEHLITIQSVLGDDIFQDVATIELGREDNDNYSIVIIGNHYIYGNDYMIRPVYVHRPTIFSFFFTPLYQPWHSPYYWGYYPTYYTYRTPYSVRRYREHIHYHINTHHHYEYLSYNEHHHSNDYYKNYGRHDYESKHPNRSFENRNEGVKNRQELNQNRRSGRPNTSGYRSTGKSTPTKAVENRRGGSVDRKYENNSSPVKSSTNKPEQRRSVNSERSVKEPVQNKSQNIDRPSTKKAEDKPVIREKSAPTQVKSRSENNQRSESPKVKSSQQQRSSKESGSQTRRSESSVKKQAPEKKAAPENKSTESNRRE